MSATRGYRSQSEDTQADVDRLQMEAYRRIAPAQKWRRVSADCLALDRLAAAGRARRAEGEFGGGAGAGAVSEADASFQARNPDGRTASLVRDAPLGDPQEDDPLAPALRLIRLLDELGVSYAVGGSVASSIHGEPRATEDVDVVVDLPDAQVGVLVEGLASSFYVSERHAHEAVRRRGSFNVIDMGSARKVDVFVADDRARRTQLGRRQAISLGVDGAPPFLYVVSAEDIVVQKLAWFRRGGERSERQWRDVLGVLKVQGERLDLGYLLESGEQAGVADLLSRALVEAGLA
jgi:hypothetical protein